MATAPTAAGQDEQDLLERARAGDEAAFGRLVERYRGELQAHCYRMLGSVHDAEDALQEALLRAWRGLAKFEGRSALRAWLYRIATNTCLDTIERRPKRVLPVDYRPATDPDDGPGEPVVESVWVEPYADEKLSVEELEKAPDARYEQREGLELAFIAALQHLPALQRAVLISREVLGFSARETAQSLDSSTASVNSALQRARKTVDERLPERSQQATLRSIGDRRMREIVERYIDAMQRGDVDAVVSMLAEDAAWSMPPLASWFGGGDLPAFIERGPLSGEWRWRFLPTRANAQPTVAAYTWDPRERSYLAFSLNLLSFEGDRIKDITSFINRSIEAGDRDYYARWPAQPLDSFRTELYFGRFGLPARLD